MEDETEAAPAAEATATSEAPATENTTPVETTDTTPETAETKEAETSDNQPDKPRSLNRTQRLQRKAARLATMLAEKDAQLAELRAKSSADTNTEPKEADFNGDYFAYQRALNKWDMDQRLSKLEEKIQPGKPDTAAVDRGEFYEELKERVDAAKKSLPDFDQKLEDLSKSIGALSPAVMDELEQAENPELVLYHLANNPAVAARINRLGAKEVIREISRIDSTVSLPQPRKQTQAPAPLATLKGGASPAKDPSKMSMDEYVAWRKKQDAADA